MKGRTYHTIYTWLLLICFTAGQYMIYAHQHTIINITASQRDITKNAARQTVTEKCALCDVMHHNVMATASTLHFSPVLASLHFFKTFNYTFTSIQLVLAGGRAPPVLV